MDRIFRQQINKELPDLNNTTDQMNLTDPQNVPCNSRRKWILLKCIQTFSRVGHKTCLYEYKNIKLTPSISSNHNEVDQEINNRRKIKQFTNMWNLNNTSWDHWVKEDKKISWDKRKQRHKILKFMRCKKSSTMR